jgi:hypothetical protein
MSVPHAIGSANEAHHLVSVRAVRVLEPDAGAGSAPGAGRACAHAHAKTAAANTRVVRGNGADAEAGRDHCVRGGPARLEDLKSGLRALGDLGRDRAVRARARRTRRAACAEREHKERACRACVERGHGACRKGTWAGTWVGVEKGRGANAMARAAPVAFYASPASLPMTKRVEKLRKARSCIIVLECECPWRGSRLLRGSWVWRANNERKGQRRTERNTPNSAQRSAFSFRSQLAESVCQDLVGHRRVRGMVQLQKRIPIAQHSQSFRRGDEAWRAQPATSGLRDENAGHEVTAMLLVGRRK